MEFLRSVNIAIALFVFIAYGAIAQDHDKTLEAFSNSYTFETEGEYSKAIDVLKQVYSEDSYALNLRLGWLNYMGGFFTDALAYYQKCMELKPLSLEAKFGYIYPASALGNWEQVKKQYNDILEIDPQNTLANYRLGSIYYGNEDYNTAIKYFEKVVNLYPFDYDGLLMYGWTNYYLGKFREAEVLFKQAMLNRPYDKSATEGLEKIK